MADTEREATDRLLSLGSKAGQPLSPLGIQKMLYFLEGLHLALMDAPLFDEEFQASAYGPVLPSVHRRLRKFDGGQVSPSVICCKPDDSLSGPVLALIDHVFGVFADFDGLPPVGLRHDLPNTPWSIVRRRVGAKDGAPSEAPIDIQLTACWFKEKWAESLKPRSSEIVFYSNELFPEWVRF